MFYEGIRTVALGNGVTPPLKVKEPLRINNFNGGHLIELAKLQGIYLGCRVPDVEIT